MANILFIPECYKVIEGMKNKSILTLDGEFYRKKTIKSIIQETTRIEEYCDNILMENLNYEWTENYKIYLLNKGYAKNTITTLMSRLRFWIRYFHKLGKISYSGAGIRVSTEITTAVFNTIDDLLILYNLKLPPGKKKVIDIYICQCFLGLRVSDLFSFLYKIKQCTKVVEGRTYFEIKTKKTGSVVVIPAAKIVLQIFENYNYNFGRNVSEWYYNRTLKEVISKTEIEKGVLFYRTEGGEKIERMRMFSEMIGSHTARRTFASNAYLMGIDPLDIMKITGHKSYNSFFKYLRCDNFMVAMKVSTHDFFNLSFDKYK